MDLIPDTLLKDRYRIIRKLGQGGMGAVFLALDLSLDHEVALKVNHNLNDGSGNQFLREARLLAALRHPNLPRVTDYFILDGAQYLVMDYIPGDDLDELVKRSGPQLLGRVLAWAKQLGGALAYMHAQNPAVIHRDIKPGNIKLSADGQAVLVDFGIAKAAASDQVTATALRGYTPGFAPPEQYGEGRTGPHTDQYALAATLYMLLSGVKPVDAIQRMLGQAVLTPLTVLVPGMPAGVQASLEKALSIRPDDRFAGVGAFVEAFEAGVSGGASASAETVVRPADPRPQLPATAPRRPKSLAWLFVAGAGGLLVLALLAVGAVLALRGLNLARPAASATPVAALPSDTRAAPLATDTPMPSDTPIPPQPTPSGTATQLPATDTAIPSLTPLPPTATLPALGKGGLIAFVSDRADGKTLQIWTMRALLNDQGKIISTDLNQLTKDPGDKRQPRWSPDGSELIYVAPGGGAGETDLWKIRADGSSAAVDITKNRKGSESDPTWSPDGKQIAFTADNRGDGVLQVYVMNADGSKPYRLSYDQDESSPVWSPQMDWLGFVMNIAGNRIFYLRAPSDAAALTPAPPFYVTPRPFDPFDLRGDLGQVGGPVWSPDGGWIAYTRLKNNGERVMLARYPLKAVDTDIIPLSAGTRDLSPAWSPDSQWLTFVSFRDQNPEIYVMRATGKNQTRLTDSASRDLDPSWQSLP